MLNNSLHLAKVFLWVIQGWLASINNLPFQFIKTDFLNYWSLRKEIDKRHLNFNDMLKTALEHFTFN